MATVYTQPYITLKDVVTSFLNEKGLSVDENFKQYMRMVTEQLSDLSIYTIKSSYVNYSSQVGINNTIKLPADYVDWIVVGIVENNVLYPIIHKDSAFLPPDQADLEPNFETPLQDSGTTWNSIAGYYYASDVYFSVDKELRYMAFMGYLVGKTVGIKYTTSGIRADGQTLIPVELRIVLKDWLHWRLKKSDDNAPSIKVMEAKQDYDASLRRYNKMQNSFTYQDMLSAMRSGYTKGPKS